jgi:putative aldouronate transport system substrate-binding protein
LPDHVSFFYRKDWASAVGFPIKDIYKTSEVIEYGRLIKEKDPGKVGAKLLPISSRPNWSMRLFVLGNYAHYITFFKDKDGVYKWGPAQPEVLAGLKLWYKAYSTGVLNPEFYTVKDLEDYDQFRVSAVSGGYYGEATANHIFQTRRAYFGPNTGLDPDECVGVATVVGEDGNYHLEDLINYWGCHIFNPNISDEKLERWLDMLDFGATDAGYRLLNMGFEGVDWKWGDNGEMVSLLAEGQRLGQTGGKYPSISGNTIAGIKQGDDLSFENPVRPKQDREDSKRLYADRSRLSTPDTLCAIDWDLFCFDSPSMRKTNLDFQMEYANLVTSAKSEADLENLWRRWVQTQMPLIQPVLDELNTQLGGK